MYSKTVYVSLHYEQQWVASHFKVQIVSNNSAANNFIICCTQKKESFYSMTCKEALPKPMSRLVLPAKKNIVLAWQQFLLMQNTQNKIIIAEIAGQKWKLQGFTFLFSSPWRRKKDADFNLGKRNFSSFLRRILFFCLRDKRNIFYPILSRLSWENTNFMGSIFGDKLDRKCFCVRAIES